MPQSLITGRATDSSPRPAAAPLLCVNEKLLHQFATGPYVVGHRLCESHHTHYSWLHWRLTWLRDRAGGETGDWRAEAGVCVCVRACVFTQPNKWEKQNKQSRQRHRKSRRVARGSVSAVHSPMLCAASLNFPQSVSHPSAHPSHHAAARRCAAVQPVT